MGGEDIEARLDAIERAIADGDMGDLEALADAASWQADVDDLEARVDELESHVADLEAGLQAVRGYVGNVRSVNREVERRAEAALATTEKLERELADPPGRRRADDRQNPAGRTSRESDDRRIDGRPHDGATGAGTEGRRRSYEGGAGDPDAGGGPTGSRGRGSDVGAPGAVERGQRSGDDHARGSREARSGGRFEIDETPGDIARRITERKGHDRSDGSDSSREDDGLVDRLRDSL